MSRILNCANTLIANNSHLFEKKLWSELGAGDATRIIPAADAEDEADRVVAELLQFKFQRKARASDFAILYRSNHQSRVFEAALRQHQLPYQISGSVSFFERAEIKDLLAYFRLMVNPDNDTAFLRIINTPRRDIGAATLQKLGRFASEHDTSLLTACNRLGLQSALSPAAYQRLSVFYDWINEWQMKSRDESCAALCRQFVKDLHYTEWLLLNTKDKQQAQNRIDNVNELLNWIDSLEQKAEKDDKTLTVDDLVAKLTLMDVIERNEEKSQDAVHLMTLHASKGLEFPYVFLIGIEEDLLPHRNSQSDQQIEEERRLLYVGITRAQRQLMISYANSRKQAGKSLSTTPSRFLQELPDNDIEWEGRSQLSPEQKQAKGNQSLATLRNLLKA